MSQSQSSLRSVGILTICSFVQLGIQFGIQLVLARQFGTTDEMDTYVAAMSLPTVLSAVLVGSLNSAFLPVYMTCRLNDGEASAHRFSSQLGVWIFAVTALIATVSFLYPEFLMAKLHPGFTEEKVRQTAIIFRFLIWLTITNGLTSFSGVLHHGEKRFRIPAFSGLAGVGLTFSLLFIESYRSTPTGVAQAVLLGSIVCVLLQSKLFLSCFSWSRKIHPVIKTFFIRWSPIIIASLLVQIGELVNRSLASGKAGSISELGFAWRIISSMQVLMSGFSVVIFPTLSAQHATNQMESFVTEVAHGWRFMAVLLIPICAGLAFFSEPIIRDLFQRGEFTAEDTQKVAFLVVLFLGVLAGSVLGTIAVQTLNALKDTLTPALLAVIVIPISIFFKFQFGNTHSYGVPGIAVVTSLTFLFSVTILVFIIRKRVGKGIFKGLLKTSSVTILSTGIALGLSALVIQLPIRYSALIAAPVGAVSYLLTMWALRNEFAIRMMGYLIRKRPDSTT
ncbi:Proposed peptidoglycan lipid II flippase MurJ [hydrothermal vent metagenome]|uniref:Proposed peptidoglycan lipid II flippase MurJ n=1 Tax=hydrothermal vent metagenome TaxID=652676 RepID=A0A3B1DNT0_9ZZZZ